MKTMALQISAASIAAMTASAALAAETWVQCDGAIVTTGADGNSPGETMSWSESCKQIQPIN